MKIGQYCQRQRCKHVELERILGRFSRRAGLSAIAEHSCKTFNESRRGFEGRGSPEKGRRGRRGLGREGKERRC